MQEDNRKKAMQLWLKSNGQMKISEIAECLGENPATVRKWKSRDNWADKLARRGLNKKR